jgi:hypothetical protein
MATLETDAPIVDQTTAEPTNEAPVDHKPLETPEIGQPVWYYADHARTKGMKSHDWDVPFAALVTYVWDDRLVNLLVVDHDGSTFALARVPVFQGDDEDDRSAPFHCELEAPKAKAIVTASGVEGQPITLDLVDKVTADDLGNTIASVKLTFTVPVGATYAFTSEKAVINQVFAAKGAPQDLTLTTAQIAAGALADLSVTVNNNSEAVLTVVVTEQTPYGIAGKIYRFTESVAVSPAPPPAPIVDTPPAEPPVVIEPTPIFAPVAPPLTSLSTPPTPPFVPPPASPPSTSVPPV